MLSAEAPVSVVVPCQNQAARLPVLLERLSRLHAGAGGGWEIIFVDDGSSDDTFAELLAAAGTSRWIRVLRHPTPMGVGAALRTGFAHATSPVVCTLDAECTYAPERLPELVGLVHDGADIASATSRRPAGGDADKGRIRIALRRGVGGVYRALVGEDAHAFTCPFRAYRRDLLDRLTFVSDGSASVAEIMLRGMLQGCRVRQLPMDREARRRGPVPMGDAIMAHAGLLTLTASLVLASRTRRMLPARTTLHTLF